MELTWGYLSVLVAQRYNSFGFIKDRLKPKLCRWFARSLSLGGKETLLKAVALASRPCRFMLCPASNSQRQLHPILQVICQTFVEYS